MKERSSIKNMSMGGSQSVRAMPRATHRAGDLAIWSPLRHGWARLQQDEIRFVEKSSLGVCDRSFFFEEGLVVANLILRRWGQILDVFERGEKCV